ncbi:FeoB small GTPase domain-containing protein [Paenibacillus cellulositrophicus]|uniref:FeoB small GTPase domain-containing protein n=1 Tax=Paenibacillus cellulositrophicus TaxID=562959 RepID=UPI001FCCB4B4|nr:FeoB small GTPase domain-containing protein [Paenibacillus cellulositrophicus]
MLAESASSGANPELKTAVLVGFESAGKSSLFRGLTGQNVGEEANFRGSTVMARRAKLPDSAVELVDTPGIRLQDDSQTTMAALDQLTDGDTVILVVRATHVGLELPLLIENLELKRKPVLLVLTFADKAAQRLKNQVDLLRKILGISVIPVNSRDLDAGSRTLLLKAIPLAAPMKSNPNIKGISDLPTIDPGQTLFEHTVWGRLFSLSALLLMFAAPVYIAYLFSGWTQPLADRWLLDPLRESLLNVPDFIKDIVVGDYGVVSLGLYSFVWAFPVVLLVGLSVAITEESGLKDRITDALDGWMRTIGLNGRDLIPVLSGFGCNVVAIYQSRTCSSCTRKSCVSLIAFGSACSYQIGASLSIFSSGGRPWLFIPYLALLIIVGTLHARLWNRSSVSNMVSLYTNRTFLQTPSLIAVLWRVRSVTKQFVVQAMPVFIGICLAATFLKLSGILNALTAMLAPWLSIFDLPEEAAGGVLFSVLRKDGLLVLNHNEGAFAADLNAGQLLILVYLASTLTACLVTLWTLRREMGASFAAKLAGKQLATSLVSALLISVGVRLF